MRFLAAVLTLSVISALPVKAEQPFWPDVTYRSDVPTLKEVLGHESGEKLTSPSEVIDYFDALVAANPDRTKLVEYARTWNDRPLVYMVISSAENMQKLSANQAKMQKLADPRTYSESEQPSLVDDILPVSWMSYSVHGDEVSPTDAAVLTAYHLLASENDKTVNKILNDSIVVIDPLLNPDGRARFISHLEENVGLEPMEHYLAAEHRQAWPRGRTNAYLFDMNRDWFAATQPETKGRVEKFQEFFPVVHADIHEMGVNRTYFFPPPTPPFNPHISDQQKRNLVLYGEGNAIAFDDFNFDYFTREIFDAHYAGYGDSWPTFHGSIGMTFEVGSARGLVQRRHNGEIVTYRDGVHQHFVASMETMLTTATHGERLLNDFAEYRREALAADQHYLFSGDPSLQNKLVTKLINQGIEVHRLDSGTRICGTSHPAGTFVVKAGQPAGHLVRTLLDADSPVRAEFWEEIERKRDLGLSVDTYDVLAWSMPALYGLDVEICQREISDLRRVDGIEPLNKPYRAADYGYLVPNNTSASMSFLAAALRAGIEVRNADAEFTAVDRSFDRGTLLIKTRGEADEIHGRIHEMANEFQVEVVPIDESWTSSGVSFGSSKVAKLKAPKIAMAWDEPTYVTAAGATRFVIERQLGYPVTPVRTRYLASRYMDYFDVVILPDGDSYKSELGDLGLKRLKGWVERGGVLITMAEATRLLVDPAVGLLDSRREANLKTEAAAKRSKGRAPASTIESKDEYVAIVSEGVTAPDPVSGILARGIANDSHWLASGVADTLYMMYEGNDIYTPLQLVDGTDVVRFAADDELVYGGYIWEENRAQLAYKPAVMASTYGQGKVIGFVTNPTFRGFMDGFHVMLGNAIFKGPSVEE
jgi:hypothetical protein